VSRAIFVLQLLKRQPFPVQVSWTMAPVGRSSISRSVTRDHWPVRFLKYAATWGKKRGYGWSVPEQSESTPSPGLSSAPG
jgi:hypothetical protein